MFAQPTGRRHILTAGFLALAMAATVGAALGFEHIGGYIPCKLCLEQRIPYYIGAPLMVVAFVSASLNWPAWATRGLLAVGGLLMVVGLVLGIYHSGIEWSWWLGPADCSGAKQVITNDVNNLFADMTKRPPSCDQAAARFLGLSFAGWNVIASLFLAAVAFDGARRHG